VLGKEVVVGEEVVGGEVEVDTLFLVDTLDTLVRADMARVRGTGVGVVAAARTAAPLPPAGAEPS
jgi:hypothetical protein